MSIRQRTLDPALSDFPSRYAETARFSLGTARNLAVATAGPSVLFCRSAGPTDTVLALWAIDVETGVETMLVDPRALESDGDVPPAERARRERARESASGIVSFATDRTGRRACFSLGGGLFVVDGASGAVTSPEVGPSVFDPRLDPTGRAVAYVSENALRLHSLDDGRDRPLRHDDDPLVSHGRAEFVAAEEMGRSRGFWWAPDGSALLVTRVDEGPVTEWWIAEAAHPERAPRPVRYPAAGTANATVALELVTLTGQATEVDWSDGGRFEYLIDVVWQEGHDPLIVRQTREQRLISIVSLGLSSDDGAPAVTERHRIEDDVWVEPMPGTPRWSRAGLLTIEDRGPTRRLVCDGTPLGPDDLNVRSLIGVADDETSAVVTAWTEPTELHLVRLPLPGSTGQPTVLTGRAGVHGGLMEGTTLVVTAVGPDDHRTDIAIHDLGSTGDPSPLGPARFAIEDRSADPGFAADPRFETLGADDLPSAVFLPSDHDGERPLPVLLDPYGGPHAQRVLKNHNPHLVSRWFAEQGYAVIVTDGRGTPGRGPAWERAVWGDLANPVLDDQLAALDGALDRYRFLDRDRVAIRGWSFGGYLAALAVLRAPDRIHAAIAGAPVTSWSLYDTHYTERYLGHPEVHPEHYRRSDLFVDTEDGPDLAPLTRPLLLIHGLADDNVVAAHTLRFSTALLATGSPHRVLPLSGVTHMTPQQAVAENLLRLQLDFLDQTVGAGR